MREAQQQAGAVVRRGRADPEVIKQLVGLNADLMYLYELE
jgi:hypothetical protein